MSDATQYDALLPCPFCGGRANVLNDGVRLPADISVVHEFWVECEQCQCGTRLLQDRSEAVARWNYRSGSEAYPTPEAQLLRFMPAMELLLCLDRMTPSFWRDEAIKLARQAEVCAVRAQFKTDAVWSPDE